MYTSMYSSMCPCIACRAARGRREHRSAQSLEPMQAAGGVRTRIGSVTDGCRDAARAARLGMEWTEKTRSARWKTSAK